MNSGGIPKHHIMTVYVELEDSPEGPTIALYREEDDPIVLEEVKS